MKTLTATVEENGRLVLVSPDLRPGATVQVTIGPTPEELQDMLGSRLTVLNEIDRDRERQPENFRTREQIDADLRVEREAWD